MSKMMENVKTINSFIRTCLVLLLVSGLGYGGWVGYERYVKPGLQAEAALAEVASLKEELAKSQQQQQELQVENDRMQTSLKLLKTDERIAQLEILEKRKDEDGEPVLEVRFTEVDEYGDPIGAARDYTIRGDQFFIDCWIASFDDKYIEQADELRGASIFAFKSIYGDAERPRDAQRLDSESADEPPGIYNDARKRAFEQQIWRDFWAVCGDRSRQKELGIRAAYGQANHMVAEAGQRYEIVVRASGGVSLRPLEAAIDDSADEEPIEEEFDENEVP
jgi:hypothetical protein